MARPLRPRPVNPMRFVDRVSATIEETCQATGLGKTTIYEMINAGAIETVTMGSRRLVLVDSVLQVIHPTYTRTYTLDTVSSANVRTATEGNADRRRLSKRRSGQLRKSTNAT